MVNFNFTSTIKKVSVGARHTLVLLNSGELFAFGDNSEGQCSGYDARYSTPFKIEFETRQKIIDVYSGYNHNLILLGNKIIVIIYNS
jgi:alpha-tubulin suppressor-like RCC1 family protein